MQLHDLQRNTKLKKKKRVGRGGKRGKTSGRGHKGQKQHGGTPRPEIRDTIKKIPKLRGHGINRAKTVNDGRTKPVPINLSDIEKMFSAGEVVSPQTLVEKGVASKQSGRLPDIKVLAKGVLTTKVSVENVRISAAAKEAVEKAGGSVSEKE